MKSLAQEKVNFNLSSQEFYDYPLFLNLLSFFQNFSMIKNIFYLNFKEHNNGLQFLTLIIIFLIFRAYLWNVHMTILKGKKTQKKTEGGEPMPNQRSKSPLFLPYMSIHGVHSL